MKNIPLFTSEYGIATLILEEIPGKGVGFVIVRTANDVEKLLEDGAKFCRMCGAEAVYGTGEIGDTAYPLAYEILEFSAKKHQLPKPEGKVKLVQDDGLLGETYDQIFRNSLGSGRWNPKLGQSFVAYMDGELAGIGQISPGKLEAIGAVKKGMGYGIATALLHEISEENIVLEVSSTNEKAIKLYKKLGFSENRTVSSYVYIP